MALSLWRRSNTPRALPSAAMALSLWRRRNTRRNTRAGTPALPPPPWLLYTSDAADDPLRVSFGGLPFI